MTSTMTQEAYAAANARMEAAQATYNVAVAHYRALLTDDATYLAARAEYKRECALYDVAYARMAGWTE